VPAHIERPEYVGRKAPTPYRGPETKDPDTIERMRVAGRVAAQALEQVARHIAPGVTTDELDRVGHEFLLEHGAYPSTLGYRGYPKSLCTSVNEVICHGIPDDRPLREGDIVNCDVTLYREGVHGDTNATFFVGAVDETSERLVRVTRECTERGIEAARAGNLINDIGRAIQQHAEANGFGVVRDFVGHGIGEQFHTDLQICHYFHPGLDIPIEEGMTFTIEPMITVGSPALYVWDDDWTAATISAQRCAQFEHTLAVTADGVEILTRTADGRAAEDLFPA